MSHPQTILHAPAPRRPIPLVRKQHQLHHSIHPYTFRSNTSDYSSTSRASNGVGNGSGSTSRASGRRSTSPVLSKSRRGSAQSAQGQTPVRNGDDELTQFHGRVKEKEQIHSFSKELTNALVRDGRSVNPPPVGLDSQPTSTTTSNASSAYDKDRTPTRKEMASISNSHSSAISATSKNLTPTGNHNRLDFQVQNPSPINIEKYINSQSAVTHQSHQDGSTYDAQELNLARSLMESPSSLVASSPSLSIDHVEDDNEANHSHFNGGHSHQHTNSASSSVFSSSSQSSGSHLSPYLNASSAFPSNSKPNGVPIIPPSPISRNQTRNPFARHFSRTMDSTQTQGHQPPNINDSGVSDALPSPNGKRALFLEQQEGEELFGSNISRDSEIELIRSEEHPDGDGIKRLDEITGISTTKKHLGGNRHKLSKSEEIKVGMSGLELGLEANGDEVMRD